MSQTMKILLGVVALLMVCCVAGAIVVTVGGTMIAQEVEQSVSDSPEEAAATGQSILNYRLPQGYVEQGSFNMLGNTMVMIAPEGGAPGGGIVIMLGTLSSLFAGDEEQMREQFQQALTQGGAAGNANFQVVETRDITINGSPTTLTVLEGTNEDGMEMRQASATFTTNDGSLGMVMMIGSVDGWETEADEEFLASIR